MTRIVLWSDQPCYMGINGRHQIEGMTYVQDEYDTSTDVKMDV